MIEVSKGIPKTEAQRAATHFGVPVSKVTKSMINKLPQRGSKLVDVAGAKMLKCPACGNLTPVGRTSVYTRCSICGTPLRHVIVKKNVRKSR